MKRLSAALICVGLILFTVSHGPAQARMFSGKFTYEAGPLDSEFSSKVIARAETKNLILAKLTTAAGYKLKSWRIPVNPDYNTALLSCMTQMTVLEEQWENDRYSYKARVNTNIESILADFGKISDAKARTWDMLGNRSAAKAALAEIKEIKGSLASSTDRDTLKKKYDDAVNRLHATDWFEKGRFAVFAGKDDEAIEAFSKATESDPDMAYAYQNRAALYRAVKKDLKLAAADSTKANLIYFNKAVEHRRANEYPECVAYFGGAISTSPGDAEAYFQRAYCNIGIKQQDSAKEDFIKAAKLGHEKARKLLSGKGIEWQ